MAQAKVNATVKALKAHMASEKKFDIQTKSEYDKAFCVSRTRGDVWTGERFANTFTRVLDYDKHENGATKVCHLSDENGNAFKYIVVKRMRDDALMGLGNQLVAEIRTWQKLADTEYGDALCPVLKYNMERSDKAYDHMSDKGQDRAVIVAQRAVYVSSAKRACLRAELLNDRNGYIGQSADERYNYLSKVSKDMRWWDALGNGGNSGVIFDYSKNCYKAVFIDYAL